MAQTYPAPTDIKEFEAELEKIVVGCVADCGVCYNIMLILSRHIHDKHSGTVHANGDSGHPPPLQAQDTRSACRCRVKRHSARKPRAKKGNTISAKLAALLARPVLEPCDNGNTTTVLQNPVIPPVVVNEPDKQPSRKKFPGVNSPGTGLSTALQSVELNPLSNANSKRVFYLIPTGIPTPTQQPIFVIPPEPLNIKIKEEPLNTPIDLGDCDADPKNDFLNKDLDTENKSSKKKIVKLTPAQKRKQTLRSRRSGVKRHKCEECDDYFTTKSGLYVHELTHETPGQCRLCGEQLSDSEKLADHFKEVHKEALNKPYACMICGMNLSNDAEIKEHFAQIHQFSLPYTCSHCEKRYFSERELNQHTFWSHTGERIYNCERCNKSFKSTSHLEIHVKTHTKEKPYKCVTCEECFYIKEHLGKHEKIHSEGEAKLKNYTVSQKTPEKNLVACGICKKGFASSRSVTGHLRNRHMDVVEHQFVCHICDERFIGNILLATHIRKSHPGRKRFDCKICQKEFVSNSKLSAHVMCHTKEKPVPCTLCTKSFRDVYQLKCHQRTHSDERNYKCDECDKSFKGPDRLNLHKKTVHSVSLKLAMCERCGRCFTTTKNLSSHMAGCGRVLEKKFICKEKECDKRFSLKTTLIIHSMIHTGVDRPYVCEHCGKSFRTKPSLTLHYKIHSGIKPYECVECGRRFLRKTDLTKHSTLHTGERPYVCEHCGKGFRWKRRLTDHFYVHTGERPYIRNDCGKSYTTSANLSNHRQVHAVDRSFMCEECGKCFHHKSTLVAHSKIHTGDKPHICKDCGKGFTGRRNMIRHSKTHIGEISRV